MKTITIFLLMTSFMFVDMERMSTYEWIEITSNNFLIYSEYSTGGEEDAELEIEMCKIWKSAATPLMQRAEKHLKNELIGITKDLAIDLIKYDTLYPLVWEEITDRSSFQRYAKQNADTCRYRMRFFDVKFSNSNTINDELSIESNNNTISRIDIELAFKNLPEKSILEELKIKLAEGLKRIE